MKFDQYSTVKKRKITKLFFLIYFFFKHLYVFLYFNIYFYNLLKKVNKVQSTADRIFNFNIRFSFSSAALKYYEILNLLKRKNYNFVLELGSGRSSLVFDYILNDSTIRYKSFEENIKYLNQVKKQTQNDFLIFSNKIIKNEKKNIYYYYENLLEKIKGKNIELIYIDGPALNEHLNKDNKHICYDIFNLIKNKIYPNVIVVDGRYDTVEALYKNQVIYEEYDFFPSYFLSMYINYKVPKKIFYHSLFIKKNKKN